MQVFMAKCNNYTKRPHRRRHGRQSLFFTMGRVFSLKIAPFHGGSIHSSLGPLQLTPKRHLHRFSSFCKVRDRDRQTDRQTDRPRYSVGNNRPHLKPRLHDTTGCQTRCHTGCQTRLTTGLTTGWMFVYTIQPVVKPVVQPV